MTRFMGHPAKAQLQGQKADEWVPGAEGGAGLTEKGSRGNGLMGGWKLRVLIAVQVTPLGVCQSSQNRSVKQVTLNCV